MVRKFPPFRSKRKKGSTSAGTPQFSNGISGKLPYHLTSNRNFRIFWPNGKHPKLPSYWNTPFSKICLGMKIGHQTKFIVINRHANSLYSLIADGQYRATSVGRNTWKTLIGSLASLQPNCNKEGFNAVGANVRLTKARIGIVSSEKNSLLAFKGTHHLLLSLVIAAN